MKVKEAIKMLQSMDQDMEVTLDFGLGSMSNNKYSKWPEPNTYPYKDPYWLWTNTYPPCTVTCNTSRTFQ